MEHRVQRQIADGKSRVLLGGGGSELVGGPCLGRLLQPAAEHLRITQQLLAGIAAVPSEGVPPQLSGFLDALAAHVPHSWGAWEVALQLEGTAAVRAALDVLLQHSQSPVVAVGACSDHGPLLPGSGKNPAQVLYPVPARAFQHAGENDAAFVARIEQEHDAFLRHQGVGVVLVEPQWGSAGLGQPWPADLLRRFVGKARAQGILVCADEMMCGLGRHGQGRTFLVDAWGVEVDAIVFGKGGGTGTFPLAGALVRRQRGGVAVRHNHTYSHALSLLTATQVLRALQAWHPNIQALEAVLSHELRGTGAQGQGALWGVPTCQPEVLHARCLAAGIDVYMVPGGVLLTPLLNASVEELRSGLQHFRRVLQSWDVPD